MTPPNPAIIAAIKRKMMEEQGGQMGGMDPMMGGMDPLMGAMGSELGGGEPGGMGMPAMQQAEDIGQGVGDELGGVGNLGDASAIREAPMSGAMAGQDMSLLEQGEVSPEELEQTPGELPPELLAELEARGMKRR